MWHNKYTLYCITDNNYALNDINIIFYKILQVFACFTQLSTDNK